MQELVIVTSCDIEYNDTLMRVEAEEVVWYVGDVPYVVDLCKDHRDSIPVSRMDSVVAQYGRPLAERRGKKPEGKGKVEGSADSLPRVDCPHPDCAGTGRSFKNRGSLSGHFTTDHGESLAAWEAEQRGEKPEVKCNWQGGQCRKKFHTVQAMTGHKMQAHGWRKEDDE